jgi:hypothetical protein
VYRKFVLVIGLLLAGAMPAPAQTSCAEPVTPPPVDGAAAHENELRGALARARDYIAQAGVYQDCLAREVAALKAQAATDGAPFEPAIEISARDKVAASKRSQQKVGAAVNQALTAYKQAHAN